MYRLLLILFLPIAFTYGEVSKQHVLNTCLLTDYNDCSLVTAIVKQESRFKSRAKLDDSLGLMQLRCSTAQYIGLKNCKHLYNPIVNIQYGIKYLRYIEDLLKTNNVKDIISSYNAGFKFKNGKYYARKNKHGEYINKKYVDSVICHYIDNGGIMYWLTYDDYRKLKCKLTI